MIAGDSCHDRHVPEEAEDSNDAEDDRYHVTEHPANPAVRRLRTEVCRIGLIDDGGIGWPVDDGTRIVIVLVICFELSDLRGCRHPLHDAWVLV